MSINLSQVTNLMVVPRRYFENIILVEGVDVLAEELFEILGGPREFFITAFEESVELKTEIIKCVQQVGSGEYPFLGIKLDSIFLEHNHFRLQPEQMIPLFDNLNVIAKSLESYELQVLEGLNE